MTFTSISDAYRDALQTGALHEDPAQGQLVQRLAALQAEIVDKRLADKKSALGWLFAGRRGGEPIRGLYIHGEVGRGKTAMMDLFYETTAIARKRRAHFHAFMDDVHGRIHEWRRRLKAGEVKGDDPIQPVASQIAAEARLLCFDEFQVEDIADAMILGRLFERLLNAGTVIVATSNTEPERLYEEGLSRDLFLPFIALIKQRMEVFSLNARTDYRQGRLIGSRTYLTPLGKDARNEMDRLWQGLTGTGRGEPMEIALKGRKVHVPLAHGGAARFSFADLCEKPLAASDYLAIADRFHTVMVDDVPVMPVAKQNEARRFVNFIDALYDNGVKIVMSAEDEPEALHVEGRAAKAFHRTASRLREMQSDAYIAA
ncbi:MAG: cell division protein ZapE [Rhodobiaceae bacterium]|nr:AFG1 family ATPase [Rhodobiaceae bacterium]MCC0055575.1 cell division protein ZapE [Rhodobiaceae bacterium]MCC0056686.1 cell division protein ZapE [Rhodobiaceae bacterium]